MNKKLKFAWGCIIAFLALIIVSYFSFVGFTYLTNGNFTYALIGMLLTDIVYALFFLGAQNMKASGVKIARKIVWERIFIFGSPIIFLAGMISMSHFWTVKSRDAEIVKTFTSSITGAKQLFNDYETYAEKRIETYTNTLNQIIANKDANPKAFQEAGFEAGIASIQRDNMVETLKLQLLSKNYEDLKKSATGWIDNANQGATTWNVFLLGNTREIKEAIGNWENQLKSFSAKELSNEAMKAPVEKFTSGGAKNAIAGIEGLTTSFTTKGFPNVTAILFGVLIYFMLLVPYILQDRHTKSIYRLIGTENSKKKQKAEETADIDIRDFDGISGAEVTSDSKGKGVQKPVPVSEDQDSFFPTSF